MAEKIVSIKIESNVLGHETKELPLSQAVCECETQVHDNGKWLYIDGQYFIHDVATKDGQERLTEALQNAKDVTLTGTLLGGKD